MRYITLLLFICLISGFSLKAQSTPDSLAKRISQRMQDSLLLTDTQKQDIYGINLQLHSRKAAVWQQYSGSDSRLRLNLQQIENTRDSLYKTVLTESQFILYKEKKVNLINNN